MRTAAACAPLVFAVLFAALPVGAVDRVARSSNVVVRERPGSSNPGIAVLKRGDRVRFFGERGGWTEVALPDGRFGWVLSAEIAPVVEPPPPNVAAEEQPSRTSVPTAIAGPSPTARPRVAETVPAIAASPSPTPKPRATVSPPTVITPSPVVKPRASETVPVAVTAPSSTGRTRMSDPVPTAPATRAENESAHVEQERTLARLETEVAELRRSVDRLAADPAHSAPAQASPSKGAPWSLEGLVVYAVTFVAGLIVGSAVQRRRNRRERTLRF